MVDSTPHIGPGESGIETVAAAREAYGVPGRIVTLCFLLKEQEILLAMKKRGFGAGRWNGTGGKLQEGETVLEAALRETKEEIDVVPLTLEHAATIDFYFPRDPAHHQRGEIFLCRSWEGEPTETDEMAPRWFPLTDIPYDAMWSDDPHWLPRVLAGEHLSAAFVFAPGDLVLDAEVLAAPQDP